MDTRAVAVLPFANLSPEPDQEYFCDGITDEIINTLAGIPDLRVIARTSMFHFRQRMGDVREIGRKLGVGTIIEGSVRKSGDCLRISASVVDAATGHRLHTASFDREIEHVFAIQDEIARDIAGSLEVTLQRPERNLLSPNAHDDLEAYTLLLHGRYLLNKMTPAGYRSTMEVVGRAISLFPAYAPYYPVLSEAFSRLYLWGLVAPQEAIPQARAAALEALRLDDRLAEGHGSLAVIQIHHDWEWNQGARTIRRVLELQPSNVYAHINGAAERFVRGHQQEAIEILTEQLSAWTPSRSTRTGRWRWPITTPGDTRKRWSGWGAHWKSTRISRRRITSWARSCCVENRTTRRKRSFARSRISLPC